jgi:hypothetical protein
MNLFGHLVGLLGRWISPAQGLYLNRTIQHRETQTHIHAPSRIEPAIPMFERSKTVLALDRAAIETGLSMKCIHLFLNYLFPSATHTRARTHTCTRARRYIQKLPDWPPGSRTANDAVSATRCSCDRYFVSQCSEICLHNPLCFFSMSVCCCCCCCCCCYYHFVIDRIRKRLDTPSCVKVKKT